MTVASILITRYPSSRADKRRQVAWLARGRRRSEPRSQPARREELQPLRYASSPLARQDLALRSDDFQRGRLEPARIAAGEDDLGALSLGAPGRLEPDAGAAADHDDRLAGTPVRAEWTWPTVT